MKLHAPVTAGLLAITAYDAGHIDVNGRRLTKSFLLTPQRLIEDWSPDSFDSLTEADLDAVAELGCPIVLLGTGPRQRFPAPALLRQLIKRRIGVEVMDSHAACRTYNILMAEGRDVAAALIIECAS
ncbi:MAG: Mth938-like domain-containing protein [Sulfuritalea sp.]|nr:Mth938-like domain-containing protein [Sulfuritalea sp.]MDP1982713.1 Mth938-like domain-containing protein [Sulfuritalea sp.]